MAREKQDDDEKPDLIAHYRPVAIRAVAAALTLKRDKPARPLRETEYSGPAVTDDADWDDEPGVSFIR
ncbi:hypothetical protein [Rhizobium lentis]|uniref:hypothetical protein n=1 Tax=Rhizobium lentis TaxID=1138194 RepID=UPI001A9289D5|nr:hypothetical protein [Rhizobium lentis]MBX5067986.1 hypothetical protein [Rhizobium lentis]MBX5080165.1 hypothetical protein [Rhizobium lentis]QSW96579.1 hypothetical protein J0663_23780 [Rhizobium lentis]